MRRTDLAYRLGHHQLALEPTGPRVPPLRVEITDGGRILVRQGQEPLLLARVEGGNEGVRTMRLPGYRPVVPPIDAVTARRQPDWTHWFADALGACPHGPLSADRWLLSAGSPPAYSWTSELVTGWPSAYLDWGRDWNGIVPLRPLSAADHGRVKACRKQLRDGTAVPILLWWISGLDGWLLLDGHDRLVAAQAEGIERPPALILARGLDQARLEEYIASSDAFHERRRADLARHADSARIAAERHHQDAVTGWYGWTHRTAAWPVPDGPAAWDALARRHAPELAD